MLRVDCGTRNEEYVLSTWQVLIKISLPFIKFPLGLLILNEKMWVENMITIHKYCEKVWSHFEFYFEITNTQIWSHAIYVHGTQMKRHKMWDIIIELC